MLRTLKEDKEKLEEIRKRQTSVIIHGLREPTNDNSDLCRQDDESTLENILHDIGCDKVSMSAVIRLGKQHEVFLDL